MANHFYRILKHWYPQRDAMDWVLATIIETDGSSYRKTGAQMLINSQGKYFGLLSGGCLESNIMQQARRCWDNQNNRIIVYDMREEEDLAWQLGIGCGGMVKIMLQAINKNNEYLHLDNVYKTLKASLACTYIQTISETSPLNYVVIDEENYQNSSSIHPPHNSVINNVESRSQSYELLKTGIDSVLKQRLLPPVKLAIVGAGVDAKPVVDIATSIGWDVVLIDPRTPYARPENFQNVVLFEKTPLDKIINEQYSPEWLTTVDAMVIMSHNIAIDAQALLVAVKTSAYYIGILGPLHRTQRVFDKARISQTDITSVIANPVGLRLGGDLPESIGLSIIAEIHAFLENADARSISHILREH